MVTIMKPTPLDIQLHVYVCNIDFNTKSITHFPWLTSSVPLFATGADEVVHSLRVQTKYNMLYNTLWFFLSFFSHFISCDIGYLSSAQPSPPLLPCAVGVNSQRHLCSFLCATVAPHYVLLGPSFSPGHLSRPTDNPQSFKVKRGIVHGWLAVTVNRTFWNGTQRNRVLIPYLFDFLLNPLHILCFKNVLMHFVNAKTELQVIIVLLPLDALLNSPGKHDI